MTDEAFLRRHVDRFNEGVRTGGFAPMLAHFAADAELVFVGVPAGPFRGKEAIARAYREQPPDDEIDVSDVCEEGRELVADSAWRRGSPAAARRACAGGGQADGSTARARA